MVRMSGGCVCCYADGGSGYDGVCAKEEKRKGSKFGEQVRCDGEWSKEEGCM